MLFQRFNPELGEFFQLFQLDSHVQGTVTLTDRQTVIVSTDPPPPLSVCAVGEFLNELCNYYYGLLAIPEVCA